MILDKHYIVWALVVLTWTLVCFVGVLFARAKGVEISAEPIVETPPEPVTSLPATHPPHITFAVNPTIQAIHDKYEAMAHEQESPTGGPKLAGQLKYAEMLKHHGE